MESKQQDKTALYLKYRPQNLNSLIGQDTVKKQLLTSFLNKKLSHAYIFVGPRGTGKTSTARILAKMVNCEEVSNVPCNKCPTCISITDGSNLDLIEIDAASNRGIDDIRQLRERIKLSPTAARKKVYIVDEVHMLTTEAFNALLKTLEEPPSHALFILATTEVGKVPQTILSRAQRLDFKLATAAQITEALEVVAEGEKIDVDKEALKLLSKRAEGSFRDGVKLLDQVAGLGNKITLTQVEESLKTSRFEEAVELIGFLSKKKSKEVLLAISKQIEDGIDTKDLTSYLMDILRAILLIKNSLKDALVLPVWGEEKTQELERLSGLFSQQLLIYALDCLQKGYERVKFTSIPSLPLELAVVEICISEQLPAAEKKESTTPGAAKSEENPVDSTKTVDSVPSVSDSPDIVRIKEKWTFVLETIRPYNYSLEALLRSVIIADCTQTDLIIEVPYSFHQRILEAPKNRDLLESIISDILGRSIRLSTVLGQRRGQPEDVANVEIAADDEVIRVAAEIFNSDSIN